MERLSDADLDLLQAMVRLQGSHIQPASLTALAAELGMGAGLLSRRLRKLHTAGWVDRHQASTPSGREVRYAPRRGVDVRWVDPELGVALSWTAGDVDWEFPLVSRVPDEPARRALVAFLRRLRANRWLDAFPKPVRKRNPGVRPEFLGLGVVVYGSTATGRAKGSSDVDVLVVHSEEQDAEMGEVVVDAASEVSLMTPRPLQVMVRDVPDLLKDKGWLPATLREEGIVVHDGIRTRTGAKDDRLWRFLAGNAP